MDTPQQATDEELMVAYSGGDAAAFEELFRRYLPSLMSLTRRHLESEEEAREIVQQTFFQLHVARADFRSDGRVRPWLFTIAMNLVRQHYRRRKRRREAPLVESSAPAAPDEEAPLERRQTTERLRRALARLPRSQREVIELHWLQQQPFAEVARIVGAREGAVRVRAHRGYARLRALLRDGETIDGRAD